MHRSLNLRRPQVPAVSGIYGNSLYLMTAHAANAAFGFLFWTIAARLYPVHEVGIAAATISGVGLMAILAMLGLDQAVIRFLPRSRDPEGIINSSLTVGVVAGGVASLVFLAGLGVWSPALEQVRLRFFFAAAVVAAVPSTVAIGLLTGVYLSRMRAVLALWQAVIFGASKIVAAVVLVVTSSAVGLVGAWALGLLVAWLVGVVLFLPEIEAGRYHLRLALRREVVNEMTRFAFTNYLTNVFWSAPALILPLIVVNLGTPEAGAYYYVASNVSAIVAMIPMAVSMSLFAHGSYDESRLVGHVRDSAKFTILLLLPATVGVFLLGGRVLLLFGSAYAEQGTRLLWVLALATLPQAVNYLFFGVRRVQQRMGSVVLAAAWILVVTLGLSALLLPRIGLLGAGVAWLAAQTSTAAVILGRTILSR